MVQVKSLAEQIPRECGRRGYLHGHLQSPEVRLPRTSPQVALHLRSGGVLPQWAARLGAQQMSAPPWQQAGEELGKGHLLEGWMLPLAPSFLSSAC